MATPRKTRGEYRPIFEALFYGKDYRDLTPEAKLTLLTLKGLCGAKGIKVWPALVPTLSELTGLAEKSVKAAVARLQKAGWIEHEDSIVWVVRGLEFEPQISQGDKHRKWLATELETMPRAPIVERFRVHYGAFLPRIDGVPIEAPHAAPPDNPPNGLSDTLSDSPSDSPCDTTTPTPTPTLSPSRSLSPTTTNEAVVVAADGAHRTRLVVRANQGIEEKFGSQPNPIRWDSRLTFEFAEALEAAGVPLDFAGERLYHIAKVARPSDGKPPSVMTYFTTAVVNAWQAERMKREMAVTPVPASESASGTPIRPLFYDAAIKGARAGDPEWIAHCAEHGIVWELAS